MANGLLMSITLLTVSLIAVFGESIHEELLLAKRFEHTTDFILDQIENIAFDAEVMANVPKNFKRSAVVREKEETCTDSIGKSHCNYLKKHNACFTHTTRMEYYCNRTCGFCTPKTPPCKFTKYGCCHDEKTPAEGYYFKGCPEFCLDKSGEPFCKAAERRGLCRKSHLGILKGCMKTCSVCRPCVDEEPLKCKAAVYYGLCSKLKFSMLNSCRRTCGFCGKKDPCASYTCPFYNKCIINSHGVPECVCKDACRKGDELTSTVCGRDGVDYPNLCALKQKSCKGPRIKVKRFGKCKQFAHIEAADCIRVRDLPQCKMWKKYGYCKTMKKVMARYCPHKCGFCAAKSAVSACHYTKYGCCMDGKTVCKGPNFEGCDRKQCKNKYRACKRFNIACAEGFNKHFMSKYCPETCYYCSRRE